MYCCWKFGENLSGKKLTRLKSDFSSIFYITVTSWTISVYLTHLSLSQSASLFGEIHLILVTMSCQPCFAAHERTDKRNRNSDIVWGRDIISQYFMFKFMKFNFRGIVRNLVWRRQRGPGADSPQGVWGTAPRSCRHMLIGPLTIFCNNVLTKKKIFFLAWEFPVGEMSPLSLLPYALFGFSLFWTTSLPVR